MLGVRAVRSSIAASNRVPSFFVTELAVLTFSAAAETVERHVVRAIEERIDERLAAGTSSVRV